MALQNKIFTARQILRATRFSGLMLGLAVALLLGSAAPAQARPQCNSGYHNEGTRCVPNSATKNSPASSKSAARCKSNQEAKKITSGKNKGKWYCVAKKTTKPKPNTKAPTKVDLDTSGYETDLPDAAANSVTLQQVLQIVFGIVGALAVLFIVIGGLRFVLAGGDPQAVAKARGTILHAVVGLIIVIAAETIVALVLDKL